jgi:glutamate racemase
MLGVFDSGLGGLSVYQAIHQRLPQYDTLYLGDNARTPYGNRSFDAILRFTRQSVAHLFEAGCDLVIIACNTASAKALRTLQQQWLPQAYPDRRLLGIIRPSAEALAARASQATHSRVALWATEGTVRSESYPLELAKLAPALSLVQTACPLLVPLVEAGELDGTGTEHFIREYWKRTIEVAGPVDALMLGCTHYPLLYSAIRRIVPPEIEVLIQGPLVAESLTDYLKRHPERESKLSRNGTERFQTTDRSEGFTRLASLFLQREVSCEVVELEKG